MKEFGAYLSEHNNEDFWREVVASSAGSVVARNETLKIEAGKLRNEKNRLILDNISDIMDGELKRTEIRNELRQIKHSNLQDIHQELKEIEQLPRHQPRQFLIEREQDIVDLFELPDILSSLRESNLSQHAEVRAKLEQHLKNYPKLRAAILSYIDSDKPDAAPTSDKYLEYKKLIECKQLNQSDLSLLQTQYEPLVSERLKRRALGRYLVGLWLNNSERQVFWMRDAALLKQEFERQKHF